MRIATGIILALLVGQPASAAISWNVTFNDVVNNTGSGFDDAALGADRRNTLNSALDYISSVVDHTASLDFTVNNSQTDGSGALASAGTSFFTGTNGFTNGVMFQHATTGVDPAGGNDGSATFDFGYNWNSQIDATAGSEFDLFTVSLHEITHAMGFLSLVSEIGESAFGGNPGVFSVFDSFLELGDGTDLFSAGGSYNGVAADLISDDVFFNGANAVAANGGSPVKIFAPTTYNDGSSISHVDTATFPTAVMTHAISAGVEKRTYSAIDRGILQDIGWNVVAVPEPASFALLAVGMVGLVTRRNRNITSMI